MEQRVLWFIMKHLVDPSAPWQRWGDKLPTFNAALKWANLDTVYYSSRGPSKVTDRNIGVAVQWGATYDGLLLKGYTLNRILLHSLRAGGAMALKLAGASDSTIMRVGWWTSLTYLTYIHT